MPLGASAPGQGRVLANYILRNYTRVMQNKTGHPRDTPLQIKLSPAQHAALMAAARRHDTTAALLIRHGIAAQISRLDKQAERENAAA